MRAAIARDASWDSALQAVLDETSAGPDGQVDLALLFASHHHAEHFAEMLQRVRQATQAQVIAGCSGQGIIGPEKEIEGEPALSLLALPLPGAALTAVHLDQDQLQQADGTAAYWHRQTGVAAEDVNGWLMFADPFHLDCEALLKAFGSAYPGIPLIGGLASGSQQVQRTHLFLNDRVYEEGAIAVALAGAYTVKTVVSQGCDPIGEPWIITSANGSIIEQISHRPAYEVLVETVRALPPDVRDRAARNLLVGLAIDEYKESFGRGDFLIRSIMGADQKSGAIAVGAYPRVGQTIQFQIRDAKAADEDLRTLLNQTREGLTGAEPLGALMCSCNGRGQGLFGFPDHDARAVAQQLGPVPLAGFFCNGEIGPVGNENFLHGFTASMALIVPR